MRRGDVIGIARQAIADHFGIDLRAARLGMLVFFQHDDARALAHDEAVAVLVIGAAGLFRRSLKLQLSARAWAKPATPIGQIVPSAPPASMMSASPSLIIRAASPIECAPVEQAVTTAWFGPIRPYLIETWPEIRLIRRPWTKCGETRPGPFRAARAIRSRSPAGRRCPNRSSSRCAAQVLVHVGKARVFQRLPSGIDAVDDERIDLTLDLVIDALVRDRSPIFVIGRLHLAGDVALLVAGIEAGDRPAPDLPAIRLAQVVSTSAPSGVTRPRPVTTTRRMRSPLQKATGPAP
jgi:hypothetical protein